jgi:hypothetical protein
MLRWFQNRIFQTRNWFNSFIYFRSSFFVWNCFKLKFWNNHKCTISSYKLLAFFVHGAKYFILRMECKRVFIKQIHWHRTNCAMLVWLNIVHVHLVVYITHRLSSHLCFLKRWSMLHSTSLISKKLILVKLVMRMGNFWVNNLLLIEWIIVRTKHGLGPLLLFLQIHSSIIIIIHSLVVHILWRMSVHLLLLLIIKVRLSVRHLILKYLLNIFWNI